ncbi:tetratricopeptide repeat protein, partial [Acinetobacter baumannii]
MSRAAISRDPSDSASMVFLSEVLCAREDLDGAAEWLNKAILASPTDRDIYLRLAKIHLKRKKADKAVDCLRRALDLDTRDFDTLL